MKEFSFFDKGDNDRLLPKSESQERRIQVDPNLIKNLRQTEGLKNYDDVYELEGVEIEHPDRKELIGITQEFITDMRERLKEKFDELIAESRENATSVPPEIVAYMEKTGMNLAQFSVLEGETARLKVGEYPNVAEPEQEDGLVIIFNLPKPIGQFWWKGGVGLWGEQVVDVNGKVIEWGYFYRKLMETVWETIGYYESETPLVLNRLNDIGEHDPKNYYYIWEASLRR